MDWMSLRGTRKLERLLIRSRIGAQFDEPLMYAAAHGHVAVVRLILDRISQNSNVLRSAFICAFYYGHDSYSYDHMEIILLLATGKVRDADIEEAVKFYACFVDHIGPQNKAAILARNASDFNNESTTLVCAMCSKDKKVVKKWLDRGISTNLLSATGKTALEHTADLGSSSIVHLLLSNKAVNGTVSALASAVKNGHDDIVKLLLDDKIINRLY